MWNKYSWALLITSVFCLFFGIPLVYNHVWFWGFLFLTPGVMIISLGWKQLSGSNTTISVTKPTGPDSKPRQVGLIKVLGKRTETVVEGTVLLLDWIPGFEIIGISIFDRVLFEETEPHKIPKLLCKANDDPANKVKVYVDGEIKIAFIPDIKNDSVGTPGWKSAGEKLGEFDDAGGYAGVMTKLKSIATTQAQETAKNESRESLELNSAAVSISFTEHLNGVAKGTVGSAIVTKVGLGVIIFKADFNAVSSNVVRDAADGIVVEQFEQASDAMDGATFNKTVQDTIDRITADKKKRIAEGDDSAKLIPIPTWDEVRKWVYKNRLARAGVTQRFEGGNLSNFHLVNEAPGGGKKGGK